MWRSCTTISANMDGASLEIDLSTLEAVGCDLTVETAGDIDLSSLESVGCDETLIAHDADSVTSGANRRRHH